MALEESGVPTVTIFSSAFGSLAQAIADRLGYPGLPIVIVPHPVGDPDPNKVTEKGLEIVGACVRALTGSADDLDTEFGEKRVPMPPGIVAREREE